MKFYNHFYLLKYLWVSLPFIFGQEPFLEIRPFSAPSFEQYPARQHVDHQLPTSNIQDGTFLRLDGASFSEDIIYPNCVTGSSCYDGHAGIDFHMPFNTPIFFTSSILVFLPQKKTTTGPKRTWNGRRLGGDKPETLRNQD